MRRCIKVIKGKAADQNGQTAGYTTKECEEDGIDGTKQKRTHIDFARVAT